MDWIISLFTADSVAHSILIVAIVIALGILLGKIKVFGISLGVTWILFVGILLSHFGFTINPSVRSFISDFGLILFVFSLGLQVGPGFFASFKKGGMRMNMLAALIVLLGVGVTFAIHFITGEEMPIMVGVMSGAVTNTPGLGAAQQTVADLGLSTDPTTLATGYAVAYPLGVVGVILTLLGVRAVFRINIDKEKAEVEKSEGSKDSACNIAVEVRNESIVGRTIYEVDHLLNKHFVVSRQYHADGRMEIPTSRSVVNAGDKLLIITSQANADVISAFIGKKIDMDEETWEKLDTNQVSRRLVVTNSNINGKSLKELNIRAQYGLNITRVNRAGIDLTPTPNLHLQLGDRIMVVGNQEAILKVAKIVGDQVRKLREPKLIPIFIGIFFGIIVGSIPIAIPGLSAPLKLGLAGGSLVVAILIARFGPNMGMVTYTTASSNMMLREVGISLFLAAVGLGAGENFVEALTGGGYIWILYGFLITVVPLIIVTILARAVFKMDYFSIAGMVCGSHTNPPALAFMNNTFDASRIAVAYATVYPLSMFLRVIVAQLMVLI
ncbi:MAG TPA: putative transporter [Candidatus Coprenecus pullistercoris]|nr:putative transporter [Candidatus Coprenecus pullistercoris]